MRRARPAPQPPSSPPTLDATDDAFRRSFDALCNNLNAPLTPAAWRLVHHAVDAARSDPYGDGDQSPLAAAPFHPLRKAWATGLDARDAVFKQSASCSLHRCAWEADVHRLQSLIRAARDKQRLGSQFALTHLLEKRLSNLRLSPLHYVCFSARSCTNMSERMATNYVDVVHALCRAGARVDSRDIAGYTPLSIACSFISNPTTLRMARVLVAYGADPNANTRFGEHIVVSAVIGGKKDAFRTLLRAGADLSKPDRSGVSPRDLCSRRPEFQTVIAEIERELSASSIVCDVCGKAGVNKICAACRTVYYCSRECQRDGWRSGHRERCTASSCVSGENDITSGILSDKAVPGL
ncbi:hypothetical protein FGB62_23g228 [Gracilaria domingensis]|nr:hypothetical protein FGB62_23g228 [Gracilaria domingensis]